MKKLSVLFVLISGSCWAGMTVFIRMLRERGLSTLDIVLVRCAMTSLLLLVVLLLLVWRVVRKNRKDEKDTVAAA